MSQKSKNQVENTQSSQEEIQNQIDNNSKNLNVKKEVHLIIQGKGGVGKTLVSSLLMQYFIDQDRKVIGLDTDPVNRSFKDINSLKIQTVNLYKNNQDTNIDYESLDKMLTDIIENPATYVIDNGAASFKPMMTYFITDGALEILFEHGYKVILHLIIATGQELNMTMTGTFDILEAMNKENLLPVIVWINEKNGHFYDTEKIQFEDTEFYKKISDKIEGIIYLYKLSDAHRLVFDEMLKNNYTFKDAKNSKDFLLVQKSRLNKIQKTIYEQITNVMIGF